MSKDTGSKAWALVALALALTGCSESAVQPEPEELGEPDAGTPPPPPPPLDAGIPVGCVQVPETWTDGGLQWGTPESDELLDAVVDREGRLYLAGYENGSLDENILPGGLAVGALWTLPQGAAAMMPRVLERFSASVAIDALTLHPDTGALYFAGRTTGAFPGYTSQGRQDLIVGDVAPDGAPRVLFQGGDAYPQHPTRLAFDAARDLLIAGYDDYFVQNGAVERWEDGFVMKLRGSTAPLQQVAWWRRDSAGSDLRHALGTGEASGAFYVGGESEGAQRGAYVEKRDAQGALLWSVRPSGFAGDAVAALHVLPDGSVLLAGTTSAILGERSYGGHDAFVQRLDGASGAVLWTAQLGSADGEWVTDLAVDPVDGAIVIVGETLGTVDPAHPNAGGYDPFLARLAADGRVLEVRQWGSAGLDERATAVAVDACGRAVVVGFTDGALLGPNRGSRDAFVVTTPRTR